MARCFFCTSGFVVGVGSRGLPFFCFGFVAEDHLFGNPQLGTKAYQGSFLHSACVRDWGPVKDEELPLKKAEERSLRVRFYRGASSSNGKPKAFIAWISDEVVTEPGPIQGGSTNSEETVTDFGASWASEINSGPSSTSNFNLSD